MRVSLDLNVKSVASVACAGAGAIMLERGIEMVQANHALFSVTGMLASLGLFVAAYFLAQYKETKKK